jgi:hypothetical protein
MEHTKKLMLVDPRIVRPSMKEKNLTNLDQQITNILNSDLPDDIKAKQYMQASRTFKNYDTPSPPPTTKETSESDVIASIQPANQFKAKRLLEQIKKDPDTEFNERGELVYRQSVIPNSNIVDLVSDVLQKKSSEFPTGWKQFANSLKGSNTARELINNSDRWKYMHRSEEKPAKEDIMPKLIKETKKRSKKQKTSHIEWEQYSA